MEIGKAEGSGRMPYQGSSAAPSVTPVHPEVAAVPKTSPQPASQTAAHVLMQDTQQPAPRPVTQKMSPGSVAEQNALRSAEQAAVREGRGKAVSSAEQNPAQGSVAQQTVQGTGQSIVQGTAQNPALHDAQRDTWKEKNAKEAEEKEKRAAQNLQLKKAVTELNRQMKESEAVFGIHDKTNRVTIKIVDKATKEVIREFPPEQTLDMIAKVWEVAGILVDEKM